MLYPWVLFGAFRQRIYAGMTMAESVCTSAGFGAYPVEGRNRSGHGPTLGYAKLKAMYVHTNVFLFSFEQQYQAPFRAQRLHNYFGPKTWRRLR